MVGITGRDAMSVLAGGGVKGGYVYGKSDGQAAYPAENPVAPRDLIASVYHLLGVQRNRFSPMPAPPCTLSVRARRLQNSFRVSPFLLAFFRHRRLVLIGEFRLRQDKL
jgi:hypothetical protein